VTLSRDNQLRSQLLPPLSRKNKRRKGTGFDQCIFNIHCHSFPLLRNTPFGVLRRRGLSPPLLAQKKLASLRLLFDPPD